MTSAKIPRDQQIALSVILRVAKDRTYTVTPVYVEVARAVDFYWSKWFVNHGRMVQRDDGELK